jgi:hypothetical protein
MDTLAFGYILPTTGRIRDFHPLETCAAGRTDKTGEAGCLSGFESSLTSIKLIFLQENNHDQFLHRQL